MTSMTSWRIGSDGQARAAKDPHCVAPQRQEQQERQTPLDETFGPEVNGHRFVIGPTHSGKTYFFHFLKRRTLEVAGCIRINDKGQSCAVPRKAMFQGPGIALAMAAAALAGCSNLSGLDASDKFACSAPTTGMSCTSVSNIYASAKANTLPGQRRVSSFSDFNELPPIVPEPRGKRTRGSVTPAAPAATSAESASARLQRNYDTPGNAAQVALAGVTPKTSPKTMNAPNSGMPMRTPERILRVWLAPFEDQEGDLHDQQYFYVTVNNGAWSLEANKLNIRSRFQQVYPLSRNNPANNDKDTPTPQQAAAQTLPVSPVVQSQMGNAGSAGNASDQNP